MIAKVGNFSIKKLVTLTLFALVALASAATAQEEGPVVESSCTANGALVVSFLDVGQGEATLIRCPDGQTQTLIDAGTNSELYPDGSELFRKAFLAQMQNDQVLELAINTHPHPDHIAGFKWLLSEVKNRRFKILKYVDNGADNTATNTEEDLRAELSRLGVNYLDAFTGSISKVSICPESNISLEFLNLDRELNEKLSCPDNLNDCSLINKLDFDGGSILFTGDATVAWEKEALKSPSLRQKLPSTILKVGHHGSQSTSSEFLKVVNPKIAVLSTGAAGLGTTEQYHFPQLAIIERLNQHFQNKLNSVIIPHLDFNACIVNSTHCEWVKVPPRQGLFSTAAMGTILLHIKNQLICVQSERMSNTVEVTF